MKRWALAAAAAFMLAACSTFFVPSFHEELYKSLEAGNTELAKLHQAILVDGNPMPDFAKVEAHYVSVLAHFSRARSLAQKRPDTYSGLPAANSANLVARAIEQCENIINRLLTTHKSKSGNLQATDFDTLSGTCSIPSTMEALLRK